MGMYLEGTICFVWNVERQLKLVLVISVARAVGDPVIHIFPDPGAVYRGRRSRLRLHGRPHRHRHPVPDVRRPSGLGGRHPQSMPLRRPRTRNHRPHHSRALQDAHLRRRRHVQATHRVPRPPSPSPSAPTHRPPLPLQLRKDTRHVRHPHHLPPLRPPRRRPRPAPRRGDQNLSNLRHPSPPVAMPPHHGMACWYSDVHHEVRPVTSGYRWVLTYNLAIPPNLDLPSAASLGPVCEIRRQLIRWLRPRDARRRPGTMYYRLSHDYTEYGIGYRALKGVDRIRVDALKEAAAGLGAQIFLAVFEMNGARGDGV